jgi:hypothetical protein
MAAERRIDPSLRSEFASSSFSNLSPGSYALAAHIFVLM